MGGGDLNMKKSWHPVLMKNQEKVWLKEKEALEEKKKLAQLRKEKEEERQLQELQRLQEEQTGKKRTEKLEWMYTTPATGSAVNENELEDYLLGKKRVDKILTADDNAKLGATHKNFIAVQNANTARDVASKIREDPLFAIKQQEAAAYEALTSNPLRLKEMQERNGVKPKKDKKERKKEKKERKERERADRKSHRRSLTPDDDDRRGYRHHSHSRRSPSPYDRRRDSYHEDEVYRRRRSDDNDYARQRRSPSYDKDSRRGRNDHRGPPWPRSDESRSPLGRRRSRSPAYGRDVRYDDAEPSVKRERQRSRSPYDSRKRQRRSPPPSRPSADDRAARLAAMTSNAASMEEERKERLTALLAKEKAELEAEEAARARSKGMGDFLSHEQKKVFGGQGGLEDRLRRGRAGLVSERD